MIDIAVISYITILLLLLLLGIGIVTYKYIKSMNVTIKQFITNLNIVTKISWSIIILLLLSLQVVTIYAINRQDSIPYSSGAIYDTLIVEDGVVVVGHTSTEVRDGNHIVNGGEAYIAKYNDSGDMIFENVYIPLDDSDCIVNVFYEVNEEDGNYIASNAGDCFVTFDHYGNFIEANSHINQSNSIDSANGQILYNRTFNEDDFSYTIEFNINEVSYNYTYSLGRTYQGDMSVYLIAENSDTYILSVILGEFPYSYHQPEGYNFLFEVNTTTSTINLLLETDKYRLKELITLNNKNYILSNNLQTRTTLLLEIDEDYNIISETHIVGEKDYFVLKDWFIEDDNLYMIGNEYETMTKEGFTEYFSGIINVYSLDLRLSNTIRLPLGVQIISINKENDIFYIGGRYNTTIASSFLSNKQNYPWCGVYLVYDYKSEKTVYYDYIEKQYLNLRN
jgi:hypothetical protein